MKGMRTENTESIPPRRLRRQKGQNMKLYDIAMAILNPHQRVILKEGEESSKVIFDGTANQLLEYDGLNRSKRKCTGSLSGIVRDTQLFQAST